MAGEIVGRADGASVHFSCHLSFSGRSRDVDLRLLGTHLEITDLNQVIFVLWHHA